MLPELALWIIDSRSEHLLDGRFEASLMGGAEDELRLAPKPHGLFGAIARESERLLAEHVFARLHGGRPWQRSACCPR